MWYKAKSLSRGAEAAAMILILFSTVPALALVDLEWQPSCMTVLPGEIVEIRLYAVSDDGMDKAISAMEVILSWDAGYLQLTGNADKGPYNWLVSGFTDDSGFDGLNETFADGDALYSAYAQLGDPAYATPAGLLVTAFEFQSFSDTEQTLVLIPLEQGQYSLTRIFDGEVPGLDILGTVGDAKTTVGVYPPIYATLSCLPISGTVPFQTRISVKLGSTHVDDVRVVAGQLNVTLASGAYMSNFRAGYTNLWPGECYSTSWAQTIPVLGSLIGDNQFVLVGEDVTPAPYNQPPYSPSGQTDTASCLVTAFAP